MKNEDILCIISENHPKNIPALKSEFEKKFPSEKKITLDGWFKKIRKIEKMTGKELFPKQLKSGRPIAIPKEQLASIPRMKPREAMDYIEKMFGVKYSMVGIYSLKKRGIIQ